MRSSAALVAASLALIATSAQAQTVTGFDMNRFEQSPAGSDWFAADSLDLRGTARPAFRGLIDYGFRPQHTDRGDTYVVEHQLVAHLAGSIVLFDRLRLGVGLPIMLAQDGKSSTRTLNAANGGGIGDLRLSADVGLVGRYGEPFSLAFGAQVWAPTGEPSKYTGDGKVRFSPRIKAAGLVSGFEWSGQVGYMYRGLNGTYLSTSIADELQYTLAAGARVLDNKLLIGPEILGSFVLEGNRGVSSRAYHLSALLGAHYTAGDFKFGLGAGPGLSYAAGTPLVRVLGSIEWAPAFEEKKAVAPADRDGDGVEDSKDACPDDAGVATSDPATHGCPADGDKDGIPDAKDACPDKPGVKSDDPTKNGCPVEGDGDGDGVLDKDDACPTVAGDKTSDPKTNGCPDKDKDGIVDKDDACPDIAGLKTSDPKTHGCPGDKDGDSIRDDQDACPDEAGKPNEDPKKNGCPEVFISAGQVKILEQIKFKTGSAEILKESQHIIDAVAKVLKDHTEIKKVRIEGHTDNKGAPGMNKDLSKKRAASVQAALVKAGVDKARLTSNGFGEEKPIDTNDTEAGRANNRRVEFHIEDTKK